MNYFSVVPMVQCNKLPTAITIYSTLGEVVFNRSLENEVVHEVNLSDLPNGFYSVVLESNNNTTSKKVVIQR